MKTFSDTLKRLMDERRLTATALAKQTGIPRSTISEWSTGRNPKVSEELVKLARFLDVSLEYLMTGTEREAELLEKVFKEEFTQIYRGVYRVTIERKKGS